MKAAATFVRFPEPEWKDVDEPVTRVFRTTFRLPAARRVRSAALLVSVESAARIFVNGKPIAEVEPTRPWQRLTQIGVSDAVKAGRNVLAIAATHVHGGQPQLFALLQVRFADGTLQNVASGPSWKAGEAEVEGWTAAAFDDSRWPAAQAAQVEANDLWNVRRWKGTVPPASYLRRDFSVAKAVRRARVYASAKGLYSLLVNGQKATSDLLRPGWTDYRDRFQYQAYDVTPLVRAGANAHRRRAGRRLVLPATWLAAGREHCGPGDARLRAAPASSTRTARTQRVVTDAGWRAASGPIVGQDLLDGRELRRPAGDGRLGPSPASTTPRGGRRWPRRSATVPLVAQLGPTRAQGRRPAGRSRSRAAQAGAFVFDLGQNMVGWVRLKVQGPAGTKVTLRHAEMLNPDGTLYTANLRAALATDSYILKGGGRRRPGSRVHVPRLPLRRADRATRHAGARTR